MELNFLNNYRNFKSIVDLTFKKSPLQKKKILKFHKNIDNSYFVKAEEFAKAFKQYLKNENISLEFAIDSYLKLCANIMISQLYFYEHKKYPSNDQNRAGIFPRLRDKTYQFSRVKFLWGMSADEILDMLPHEFNYYKKNITK